ncbi:MAG: hypothetical protein ABSF32_01810 [Ignavibacteria bacterium]|jgi:hypothetical protein
MKDSFKKKVYCSFLDRETNVEYHIRNLNVTPAITKKTIDHYSCELKPLCEGSFVLSRCASFKGMKRTEAEVLLG